MKRKFLFFVLLVCVSLALCVFVNASTIEADELSDINTAIEEAQTGDTVTVNMIADILVPKAAIIIEKDITVIINTSGHTLYTNPGGGSAGSVYGILIHSNGARLVINGTLNNLDALRYETPSDQKLTVSNGVIVDPNEGTGVKSPDFVSNGPAIKLRAGTLEINNTYFYQYNTGEWGIYGEPDGNMSNLVTNLIVKDSILRQPSDNSSYGALGTRAGSYNIEECLFQVDNSVIYGIRDSYWPMSKGSYIRNSRFKNTVNIDGYMSANKTLAIPRSEPVEIRNTVFEGSKFSIGGGTIHLNLIDCQFAEDMKFNVYSDRNGSGSIYITTSATCTNAGTQYYKTSTFSDVKDVTTLDFNEQYSIDNPAIGHAPVGECLSISYKDGYGSAGYFDFNCSMCGARYTEATPSAPAILTPLGYSYSKKGTGIDGGYEVNADALLAYETVTGKSLTFGIIVLNPDYQTESTFFTGKALTCASKSVTVELKTKDYSYFNFSISGFTAATENLDLIISAYAYAENDASDICFIQKQYDDGKGPVAEMFEKNDGTLYSVTLAGVRENDLDAINKENE